MTNPNTTTTSSVGCEALRDDLALVAEGEPAAVQRHAEHLIDCDDCRDARHEARAIAEALGAAGDGWEPGEDLVAKLMAAVDAGLAAGAPPARPSSEPLPAQTVAPAAAAQAAPAGAAPRPAPAREPRAAVETPRAPASWLRRGGLPALACAAAVATAVVAGSLLLGPREERAPGATAPAVPPLTGTLQTVLRSGRDAGVSGVEVQVAGARERRAAAPGETVPAGATLRTDRRTRARLLLSDGSVVVLDHDTEVSLDAGEARSLHLSRGVLVADVAHLANGPRARFVTPEGRVEVLGTKFVLTSARASTTVEVVRGVVRLGPERGVQGWAEVRAGQEGRVLSDGKPRVMPAAYIASAVQWSELDERGDDIAHDSSGLGVLRARRPGESGEREHPLSLASHHVSVRIAGNVARTEIEERFANEGASVLEGTYEFPLPPDARIVRLALDVDGRLVDGAIVERDRATKIWAGVLRHATPVAAREKKEEFVWVPGPWRDPALLEQRAGGRFGLRIFPIPAHGERRVVLAYEQLLPPRGDGRRYVYPLPHPVSAGARAARFELEAVVSGVDPTVPVVARGYEATTMREGAATRLSYREDDFVPAGDFVIDWAMPDRDAELRTWAYQSHAVLAVRPELPDWTEARRQDLVLVVDTSQSMFGERSTRAAELAAAVVAQMDRRDRFVALACDASCQALPGGARAPSAEAAAELRAWLGGIRPAGASDVVRALRTAAHAMDEAGPERPQVRVVYVGDGVATVGHRRAAAVEAEVAALVPWACITTVGIGGEADAVLLGGIARAGGGQFVPYRPTDSLATAALAVLETTTGPSLEQPTLTLPAGLEEVAPAELPTIRAGEELVVAARLSGPVRGEAILRGRVGGSPFERRYPLTLDPAGNAGNSFVPAVWAERRIADLERQDDPDAVPRIVALSKQYGVVSRHTSLLVLESEAMFRAFGVEHTPPVASWSGDEEPVASVGAAERGGTGEGAGYGAGPTKGSSGITRGHRERNSDLDSLVGSALGNGSTGGSAVRGMVAPPAMGRSSAAVSGSLDRNVISTVVRRHIREVQAVYERSLRTDPTRSGRLVLTWTIQPDGSVGNVSVRGGEGLPGQEIANVVRRWRFPAPEGAGTITVSYPFLFQTAGDGNEVAARPNTPAHEVPPARDPAPPANLVPPAQPPAELGAQLRGLGAGRPSPGGGRWMRRTWERHAAVREDGDAKPAERRAVQEAEESLRALPDSRDRHEALARALARAGDVARTLELGSKWLGRDPQDVDALLAFSDALAREGRREEALRLLSGTVDVRPDDRTLHERLAAAYERAGKSDDACAHRVTLAELAPTDQTALAAAVRCEARSGRDGAAERIAAHVADAALRERVRTDAAAAAPPPRVTGELTLEATWSGDEDVDVALITPKGARVSWMGGRSGLTAEDAAASGHERLGLRFLPAGNYLVELTRATPGDGAPVHGRVAIQALGARRTVDFVLDGPRAAVARIEVTRVPILAPVF